jgi:hypothetical protein
MAIETVSFTQIVTAVTAKDAVLYGLTTDGAVYEYNFSREAGSRGRCERFRITGCRKASSVSLVQAVPARRDGLLLANGRPTASRSAARRYALRLVEPK